MACQVGFSIIEPQPSSNHISVSIMTLSDCQPTPANRPAGSLPKRLLHAAQWHRAAAVDRGCWPGTRRTPPILVAQGTCPRTSGSHMLQPDENGPRAIPVSVTLQACHVPQEIHPSLLAPAFPAHVHLSTKQFPPRARAQTRRRPEDAMFLGRPLPADAALPMWLNEMLGAQC